MRKSWHFVLEHSIWCIAWGVAAPYASAPISIFDHSWMRVVCGVVAYPITLHAKLAWAAGYFGSVFEPAAQFLKSTYGNSTNTWFYLMPPILNFVLLAAPMILAAGIWVHLLPWISSRIRYHRTIIAKDRRLTFYPQSIWSVAFTGAGLSSLPLLWMFWVTALFLAMVSGLGNALSNPPIRESTTVIELIAVTFELYILIGIPVLLFPFALMFLGRRLLRATCRFLGPGRPVSY